MNADDPRRTDVAELARLLQAPPERDLPAGRQQALKEHLISELRLAEAPPAGQAASLRRRKAMTLIAAAGVAALAAVARSARVVRLFGAHDDACLCSASVFPVGPA